jgi:hypothetical protein
MKNIVKLDFNESTLMQLISNFAATQGLILEAGTEAMTTVMDGIYSRAWDMCPVFNGYLQSSLYKELEIQGDQINAHVGHGGNYNKLNPITGKWTDEYAIEMHESFKVSAANRARGASWKWLEKAVNEVGPDFETMLGELISGALIGTIK